MNCILFSTLLPRLRDRKRTTRWIITNSTTNHGWSYNYICKGKISPLKIYALGRQYVLRIPEEGILCDEKTTYIDMFFWFSLKTTKDIQKPRRVSIIVCSFGVYRPTWELFTHMETSPLPEEGYKFWLMLGTHSHSTVNVL